MKSAPFLDFETYLPAAHEAIMNNEKWEPIEKVMIHCMHLVHIGILGRASEVSWFCPEVTSIKFSKSKSEWNPQDKTCDWVELTLETWKGAKKMSYPMKLWQNHLNSNFDPVLAITNWLAVSGIKKGPLFPNLVSVKVGEGDFVKVPMVAESKATIDNGKGTKMTVWTTADDRVVNMHVDTYSDILNSIFVLSGHHGATTHSIRRSAAQWAARCGAPIYQILNAGRWKEDSTSWQKYVKSGILDVNRFKGKKDGIRQLWVFHPISFDDCISSLLT